MVPVLKDNPGISTIDLARMCCPGEIPSRISTVRTHMLGILTRMAKYDLVSSILITDPHGGPGIRLWTYTG